MNSLNTVHIHARDIVLNDAVGNFCRQIARMAEAAGYAVRLWAEHTNVHSPHAVLNRADFWDAATPEDVVFFNHSIFDPVLDDVIALPNPKVVYFHNVTPPGLIDPADVRTIENCRLGLAQRSKLSEFDVVMANSDVTVDCLVADWNEAALEKHDHQIIVCPPLIGADRWQHIETHDLPVQSGRKHLLYVGRLAPHKGVFEIVEIVERLAVRGFPIALDIVGGPANGVYTEKLRERAEAIATEYGVPLTLHHDISDRQLKSLYTRAAAAIAHSSHEGFCVPALDALAFDKPMFVTPLPAVIEVLGSAAIPIDGNSPDGAASVIETFMTGGGQVDHAILRHQRFKELRQLANGQLILQAISRAKVC